VSRNNRDSAPAPPVFAQPGRGKGQPEPRNASQSESQDADNFAVEVKDRRWQKAESLKLRKKVPLRFNARRSRCKRIRFLAEFRRVKRRQNQQGRKGN